MGEGAQSVSLIYIRRHYGAPAKRGVTIEFTGNSAPVRGVVAGASGAYLRVRLDGEKRTRTFHPTWEMKYLDKDDQ